MTYPWAAGEVLTAADLNAYAGLVHIATFSGTTATANFDDVFVSDFERFRVVISLPRMDASLSLRLRSSGTSDTGTNYSYVLTGLSSAGSTLTATGNGATALFMLSTNIASTSSRQGVVFDVLLPNVADVTTFMGNAQSYNTGANYWTYNVGGVHVLQTAYDGFQIYPTSGSITHKTSIYGYNEG